MSVESLMIMFILIEMFQVFFILIQVYQSKKMLTEILTQPEFAGAILSNAVYGFLDSLRADPKKQESFFGALSVMGSAMAQGAMNGGGTPCKPVKLRGFAKVFEPFINNPQIQGMIGQRLGQFLDKTGRAGVDKAAESVIEGWN